MLCFYLAIPTRLPFPTFADMGDRLFEGYLDKKGRKALQGYSKR